MNIIPEDGLLKFPRARTSPTKLNLHVFARESRRVAILTPPAIRDVAVVAHRRAFGNGLAWVGSEATRDSQEVFDRLIVADAARPVAIEPRCRAAASTQPLYAFS